MANLPSGTITFLFTNAEGNSTLWAQHLAQVQAAITHQEAIVREVVQANGGTTYKVIGTALQAAFPTAPQALQAALHAQQALHAERWPEELGNLSVRMALHTGVLEPRGNDYFGPILNRVSRLLYAAHGGQTLLTSTTSELLQGNLPPEITLKDLGEHHLRDLIQPEHVYQVVSPDLPPDFPPLKTPQGNSHNLPLQPTALIGREVEIDSITETLSREDVQLLTLTGPGGIGKTRLALQVAAELLDQFKDGVFFVSLAALIDPTLVVSTIAQTLAVPEVGSRPLLESLAEYLRDKQLLLVLDNFEQVVEAAASISELLASAPNLKALVTSRAALHLST